MKEKTTQISLKLKNFGYIDDIYSLRIENLPENFVANFKENNIAISETFVESREVKQLKLKIYILPTAEPREMLIRIVAEGISMATADLTLVVTMEVK